MRYQARELLITDLRPEPDRRLLDFCAGHARRMVAPVGWTIRDGRSSHHAPAPQQHVDERQPSQPSQPAASAQTDRAPLGFPKAMQVRAPFASAG